MNLDEPEIHWLPTEPSSLASYERRLEQIGWHDRQPLLDASTQNRLAQEDRCLMLRLDLATLIDDQAELYHARQYRFGTCSDRPMGGRQSHLGTASTPSAAIGPAALPSRRCGDPIRSIPLLAWRSERRAPRPCRTIGRYGQEPRHRPPSPRSARANGDWSGASGNSPPRASARP